MALKATSSNTTANIADDEGKVVLRDLQSLLRKTMSNDVIVVNYKTNNLLPIGENYGSTILKVDAIKKKSKNSEEETLFLVAKMVPATKIQKSIVNTTISFGKEIFVFEKLVEAYRQIEIQAGVKPQDLIDILPKFYGGRLSRNENATEGDEDAALLMENLRTREYYIMDRLNGLDYEHARLAISELARYHALGIALNQREPNFFNEVKNCINRLTYVPTTEEFNGMIEQVVNGVCVDPRFNEYKDRMRASVDGKKWNVFFEYEIVEPWISVIHGDFWANNMMFHKDENGKPNSVKFVDFQISRVCSPLKDLPYFLCGSTNAQVIENHFDELLDIYYDKFIGELKTIGCDVTPFSRDNFDEQLKKDGSDELFHCLMALKFFTFKAPDDFDLNNMVNEIMLSSASNLYLERSWKAMSKFIEKGWL